MTRRLERSTTDRVIAGICGGLAEHLQVDSTLVRVVFIIAGLMSGGLFVLGYIALLFVMPLPGQRAPAEDLFGQVGRSPGEPAEATSGAAMGAGEPERPTRLPLDAEEDTRRQRWIGYVLLALGAVFLLSEVGALRFLRWDVIWPIAIIGLGLYFVLRRTAR